MNLQTIRRLPSVESQTVAFFDWMRQSPEHFSGWLRFNGFKVYLRYQRDFRVSEDLVLGEVLVIANVELPARFRNRGWFWRYCQLCAALSPDGVVLEAVVNPCLRERLRQHPAFWEYRTTSFVLRKRQQGNWPLTIH